MEIEKRPKSEVNLRKLMQKMGLGTNAFAEACGMSSQSMAQFLRNKSLTTASIYRIAMALDIDPRDMFFPTDEEKETLPLTGKEEKEQKENTQEDEQTTVNTTTFCPHCGAKVRVGVLLMPEWNNPHLTPSRPLPSPCQSKRTLQSLPETTWVGKVPL